MAVTRTVRTPVITFKIGGEVKEKELPGATQPMAERSASLLQEAGAEDVSIRVVDIKYSMPDDEFYKYAKIVEK